LAQRNDIDSRIVRYEIDNGTMFSRFADMVTGTEPATGGAPAAEPATDTVMSPLSASENEEAAAKPDAVMSPVSLISSDDKKDDTDTLPPSDIDTKDEQKDSEMGEKESEKGEKESEKGEKDVATGTAAPATPEDVNTKFAVEANAALSTAAESGLPYDAASAHRALDEYRAFNNAHATVSPISATCEKDDEKDDEKDGEDEKSGDDDKKSDEGGEASESDKSEVFVAKDVYTTSAFTVTTCKQYDNAATTPQRLKLGEKIHDGKGRNFVIVKSDLPHDRLHELVKDLGDGQITAQFEGFSASLIGKKDKEKRIEVPNDCELLSTTGKKERFNMSNAQKVMKTFETSTAIGNIRLVSADSKLPAFEELVAEIGDLDKDQMNAYLAQAQLDKDNGEASKVQLGALKVEKRLKSYSESKMAHDMVVFVNEFDGPEYPRDYPDLDLKGFYWDHVTRKLVKITLKELMASPIYWTRSILLIGMAGAGKSDLTRALGKRLTERHGYTEFTFSKNLELMGRLYKRLDNMGAYCFADIDMIAKGKKMTAQTFKSFFDVKELGNAIPCNYHPWSTTPKRPKIISINSPDWFKQWNLGCLHKLYEQKLDEVNKCNSDEEAILRRVIIMKVDKLLFKPDEVKDFSAEEMKQFEADLAKEQS